MNTATIKKTRWFWPWQDEKEETWLEAMSQEGWHLVSVKLPCVYTYTRGEPRHFTYRLDYMPVDKTKEQEYGQIFQDAGWEYIGEMSNWRYWRKPVVEGETDEIFTDRESKLKKYRRMLGYMAFFLFFLTFIGINMFTRRPWAETGHISWIGAIYLVGVIIYAVIIPVYMVVVVQLLRRINQLKMKIL
jgi:hypothetical protein